MIWSILALSKTSTPWPQAYRMVVCIPHHHGYVLPSPELLHRVDVSPVFFLALFMIWGCLFINIAVPLVVLAISANIANFTMALSAVLTIRVNRKFLPKEYRPSWWRELLLVGSLLFFGFFFAVLIVKVMIPKIF